MAATMARHLLAGQAARLATRRAPALGAQVAQGSTVSSSSSATDAAPLAARAWATRQPRDAGDAFGPGLPSSSSTSKPAPRDLGAVPPAFAGRFYQRSLPEAQVPFASERGKQRFRQAFLEGNMENYFILAEQFRTQDEPTFCGLSTLAMVLNSLRIDPMRTWKGAWRWFSEQNLGCCTGPEQVRETGLNLDMFRCLAACNGAEVVAHRAPGSDEAPEAKADFLRGFRAAVRSVVRSKERECLVVSYSREALGQSGAGHFSPIGGYHEETDSILIMDVARFKYPPHWANLEAVAEAMSLVDEDTGRTRGWLHLRLRQQGNSEGAGLPVPLYVPYVPKAAGKRLSEALSTALSAKRATATNVCDRPSTEEAAAVNRFLRAISEAEPQVVGQLLKMGDAAALREVLERLESFPTFARLCEGYAEVVRGGAAPTRCAAAGNFTTDFPPLRFCGPSAGISDATQDEIGLDSCGELWVLLLLLLPDHLRAAVSADLAGPAIGHDVAKAVRGPWALPMEAVREALGQILPLPQARRCT